MLILKVYSNIQSPRISGMHWQILKSRFGENVYTRVEANSEDVRDLWYKVD